MDNNNSPESVALNEGDYVVATKPWTSWHSAHHEKYWINPVGRVAIVTVIHKNDIKCKYFKAPERHKSDDDWWFTGSSFIKITPEQANDPNFRRWMYACYSGDTEPLKEVE